MEALLSFLHTDFAGTPAWSWLLFMGIVAALLAFDLGVLHKDDREIGVRESLLLSAGYITAALLFGGWVWWQMGPTSGMAYYTGFLIEKSLSLDNVFVIALIFSFFAIPRQFQHRVLFWGILGVIVLRAIMIGLGAALVSNFGWLMYLFGASPALSTHFLRGRQHELETLSDDTLYLPYATSLRMSDLGYQNNAQAGLMPPYNDLESYMRSLSRAVRQPYPAYDCLLYTSPSPRD